MFSFFFYPGLLLAVIVAFQVSFWVDDKHRNIRPDHRIFIITPIVFLLSYLSVIFVVILFCGSLVGFGFVELETMFPKTHTQILEEKNKSLEVQIELLNKNCP